MKQRFDVLGSIWWVEASLTDAQFRAIKDAADQFESRYSRFRSDSLITRLNHHKKLADPPHEFVDMLRFALESAQMTDGLFNLTAGAALAKRGYGEPTTATFVTDWVDGISVSEREIVIDSSLSIDLGGFGKGWLVDLLFDQICAHVSADSEVLVNGGGDIRLRSQTVLELPLMVPTDTAQYFARAAFRSGAIASSSPLIRSWQGHNHLVDRTGASYAGPNTQVSVYAQTARQADMAATVCTLADDPFLMAQKIGVEVLVVDQQNRFRASKDFPLLKSA